MERHQSCCRLEFLGRRKRAAGMRSVCLCHSGGPGSPDETLLPCRLSSHWANAQHRLHHRGTTQLRRTESRASHHTVQTVPLLASLPSGPGFRAGLGGRSCVSVTHGTVRQCDHSTAFPRLQHQTGSVFVERKRYNNLTSCTPLNVARHARAVHCNAMHSSEQDLGGDLGGLGQTGRRGSPALTSRSKVLGSARPSNGEMALGLTLLRPCPSRVAQCLVWHAMQIQPISLA